jgi:hypothetical protein
MEKRKKYLQKDLFLNSFLYSLSIYLASVAVRHSARLWEAKISKM